MFIIFKGFSLKQIKGESHSVHPPRVEPPSKLLKRRDFKRRDKISIFRGRGCWKRGGDLFQGGGGCSFCMKNKLKSEIIND